MSLTDRIKKIVQEIFQTPPSVQQIELLGSGGNTNNDYGMFHLAQTATGRTVYVEDSQPGGNGQFQIALASVTKITVQKFPGFSPVILLCFSSTPRPRINACQFKVLAAVGVDATNVVAGGVNDIDIFTAGGANKFMFSPVTFGPFTPPSGMAYMSVYVYNSGSQDANSIGITRSAAGNAPTEAGALARYTALAWVNLEGS